jgi:hypothetical protein
MRTRRTRLALSLVGLIGCSSGSVEDWPPFVDQLIAEFEREPKTNPPASIWKYEYKGLVVFYVPPSCCDIPSVLYDSDGNVMCSPDGGLRGDGDGRCPDFLAERTGERLVWADKRGSSFRD